MSLFLVFRIFLAIPANHRFSTVNNGNQISIGLLNSNWILPSKQRYLCVCVCVCGCLCVSEQQIFVSYNQTVRPESLHPPQTNEALFIEQARNVHESYFANNESLWIIPRIVYQPVIFTFMTWPKNTKHPPNCLVITPLLSWAHKRGHFPAKHGEELCCWTSLPIQMGGNGEQVLCV